MYEPNPIWDDDFSSKTDTKKAFELGRVIDRDLNRRPEGS
jgi:hypothetical protein